MLATTNNTKNPYSSLMPALGVLAALLVFYHNSFFGPFVFDDIPAILENPTILNLRDIGHVLAPPHGKGITVEGRPLVNLSLAFNYAVSGKDPWSYHLFNFIIHSFAALFVLGIIRRTLLRIKEISVDNNEALGLSFCIAFIWALHPLQTESVTYVIQRAESLMGLFYLATLYFFIRATETSEVSGWLFASTLTCVAGMASKEVMISAPLSVLLYDWIINKNAFRSALKKRPIYYLALGLSALGLLFLAFHTGTRGGTSGFGIDISPWMYWKTQFEAVWCYISLVFWPKNLIFDYGVQWVDHITLILPYILGLVVLVVCSGYFLYKRTWIGLIAFFFFAILAPTSVMPGNRQILAEHRMYLPLISVITLCVCGGYFLIKKRIKTLRLSFFIGCIFILGLILGYKTYLRNQDYQSIERLYTDTVTKRPQNGYAHYNLGKLYAESGKPYLAISEYEGAIKYGPNTEQAYYNLGNTFFDLGRLDDACTQFKAAIHINPNYSKAHYNLGNALIRMGRREEALTEFTHASRIKPDYLEALDNRGGVLLELGRYREAELQFLEVIAKNPFILTTHINLGNTFRIEGKLNEALDQFTLALRLDPKCQPAQMGLIQVRALLDGTP